MADTLWKLGVLEMSATTLTETLDHCASVNTNKWLIYGSETNAIVF